MRHSVLKTFTAVALFISLMSPAWALSLDEAKAKGWVGETPKGYLASPADSANSAVTTLINDINQKRRAAYISSAKSAGVTLEVMESRIAQRLYERAEKGEYLQTPNGQWYKK